MTAAGPDPTPSEATYRPPQSSPSLGRGIVWSLLVEEMEREHRARLLGEDGECRSAA